MLSEGILKFLIFFKMAAIFRSIFCYFYIFGTKMDLKMAAVLPKIKKFAQPKMTTFSLVLIFAHRQSVDPLDGQIGPKIGLEVELLNI